MSSQKENSMNGMISDEVLSIVREGIGLSGANVALPSHVVTAMTARIDHQDKLLRAYRTLADCYCDCLWAAGHGAVEMECLDKLVAARGAVADLEEI